VRLAGLARRRQILTIGASVEALKPASRVATRDLDARNLKGKQDAVRVFEVVWEDDLDSTQIVWPARRLQTDTRLRLSHAGMALEFPADKAVVWLGRDKGFLLRASGSISLGVPGSDAVDAITFECF
jgi:hypothetical protein